MYAFCSNFKVPAAGSNAIHMLGPLFNKGNVEEFWRMRIIYVRNFLI
jgi:hypothetical protein